ncbi:acyl-CoA dehydrogenase [Mycolicibacterium murale]|uniref:Acyl-CoA dehydrogenase n=1 Tax=Mycolicibacterium murale TaxID=182220 RepID=A0A7I9WLV5_9MYCO|nr:acyl-CoA dehydrogenase family protein [Mycolicibacterium murale]MCV7180416.1 acyl-CoA dehydrogenase family protein [Mycolicibacterium murale]GFG58715.1 acyl-CoA dehydrogenase [Mycolicibacterium murale]
MTIDSLLTPEQRDLRTMVRAFARKEVGPRAALIDSEQHEWKDLFARMGEIGLLGLLLPEEWGEGGDMVSQALVQEELAYVSGSVANSQVGAIEEGLFINLHGSEELKQRYLPDIVSGKRKASFALTEPQAGSDASNLKTTAKLTGADTYIINGQKAWVTAGAAADIIIVVAMTEDSAGGRVPTAFLVETSWPGVHAGQPEDNHGVRGLGTSAMSFDDVEVPAGNILGKPGEGLDLSLATINLGRISTAAMSVGLGQRAFDAAMAYSLAREQFGKPIFKFQGIKFQLAQMATKLDAARLLYVHAARERDSGAPGLARAASEAKLFAADAGVWVCEQAMLIFGANGYTRENPVERCLRDARVCQIFEGTSNVQQIVIARELANEFKDDAANLT